MDSRLSSILTEYRVSSVEESKDGPVPEVVKEDYTWDVGL